jgi:hypothetical protein
MARNFPDLIKAYCDYASYSEAPRHMHFWCIVSAIAGALRRRVWIDQTYFKWFPNFYIILVAPPGIVSKSTTAGIAMELLRAVPGINFGPDVVTWQSLVTSFAACSESFQLNDMFYPMSAMTIESSEFGNLVNPHDREMIDLLIALWDGKQGTFIKETKMSGRDVIENPWINLLACTTPSWIAGNFPEYMIGGGFTSRCVFVYAEEKAKLVAYPHLHVPETMAATRQALIQDLEHISLTFVGEYHLSTDAIAWGEKWYAEHFASRPENLDEDRFGGYIARKQTHIHKLAMILAAAVRDDQVITADDLSTANIMVTALEPSMAKVFEKIGRTETSVQAERFITFIQKRGAVPYMEAYKYIHSHFPDLKDFEGIVAGALRAGFIEMTATPTGYMLKPVL